MPTEASNGLEGRIGFGTGRATSGKGCRTELCRRSSNAYVLTCNTSMFAPFLLNLTVKQGTV